MNAKNGSDIPLGLGMALMQNSEAYAVFADMTPEKQQELISKTHSVHSKKEMRGLVDSLVASD